jgi:hypothetical protein
MNRLRQIWFSALLLLVLTASGCASARVPELPELRDLQPRVPLVMVPGITGTELREQESGRLIWGDARTIAFPPDGGYRPALAITEPAGSAGGIEAGDAIMEVRIGFWSRPVYGPMLRLMESNGYRHGDLRNPLPGDTFFFFPYDWRQSNAASARELTRMLERLAEAGHTEVDLICQSNGGYICRWVAKFGDASIEEAEQGIRRLPDTLRVRNLILLGTANGGSMRMLREMQRGRRYLALIGGRLQPEVFFTLPAFFQDLPVYRDDLFLDTAGQPMAVDLFDAGNWVRFGWSVFEPDAAERADRRPEIFGDHAARLAWLQERLDYARRFHRLLLTDAATPVEIHSIQNAYIPTPDRAILAFRDGRWETWFSGDASVERIPLRRLRAAAPGDQHATVYSQAWMSPSELAAMSSPTHFVEGGHFDMINEPAVQQRLLEILQPPPGRYLGASVPR